MASGYDKHSEHEPDIGTAGRLILLGLVAVLLFGALSGWAIG